MSEKRSNFAPDFEEYKYKLTGKYFAKWLKIKSTHTIIITTTVTAKTMQPASSALA